MSLVVVPAKPLARAKARLAPVLSPDERRSLCLAMLADVVSTAVAAACGPVAVVATDTDAGAIARMCGATVIRDPSPGAGLNASLEAAIPADEAAVLIVAGDLPAVSPDDIRAMTGFDGVRLATDAGGTGTNALWRSPPDAIPLSFGDDSARAHREAAEASGVAYEQIETPGLAFDVDLPGDLERAWHRRIGDNTREALVAMGFPGRTASP